MPGSIRSCLAAAKAEGGEMTIYSDTNEGEGLPLWKLFTDATGIKVNYMRGADPPLMARMVLEYRANQKSWDVAQLGTIDKIPPQLLLPFDPPEAKNISPQARDPGRRWYGLYANYNSPAYNTEHVKASELPKSLRGVRAAQGLGRPRRHRRHRQRMAVGHVSSITATTKRPR